MSTNPTPALCYRCHAAPRALGTSYCRDCRRAYDREYKRQPRPQPPVAAPTRPAPAVELAYKRPGITRFCSGCGRSLPVDDRHFDATRDNPRAGIFNFTCRDCDGTVVPDAPPARSGRPAPPEPEPERFLIHDRVTGRFLRIAGQILSDTYDRKPGPLPDKTRAHYETNGYRVIDGNVINP